MRHWPWVLLTLGLVLPGCGSPSDSKQPQPGSKPAVKSPAALKTYAAGDLPAVSETRLVLDGYRVELSPPEGWKVLPRDSKYLIRLVKGTRDNSLPRLTVVAEPAPEGMADVTAENVAEFVRQREQQSAAVPGRKILEPDRPIVVGDYAWSRHVRQLSARGSSSGLAAVQSLATARGGRLYVIELTVETPGDSSDDFAKAVLAHRDAAYALAANWKFIGAAAEPAATAPDKEESPPESAPAKSGATGENPAPADPSPEKNPD
ncbi:MAG TPA: hypothetical protein VMP01_19805 [Pirellulaceae bacterium]|nr:hypothetical protein [Pirellulaceae bacterium]